MSRMTWWVLDSRNTLNLNTHKKAWSTKKGSYRRAYYQIGGYLYPNNKFIFCYILT